MGQQVEGHTAPSVLHNMGKQHVGTQHVRQQVQGRPPPCILPMGTTGSTWDSRMRESSTSGSRAGRRPPTDQILRKPPCRPCTALVPHCTAPYCTCDTGANMGCWSSLATPLPARQAPNSSSADASAGAAPGALAPPPPASASTARLKKKGAASPDALELRKGACDNHGKGAWSGASGSVQGSPLHSAWHKASQTADHIPPHELSRRRELCTHMTSRTSAAARRHVSCASPNARRPRYGRTAARVADAGGSGSGAGGQ